MPPPPPLAPSPAPLAHLGLSLGAYFLHAHQSHLNEQKEFNNNSLSLSLVPECNVTKGRISTTRGEKKLQNATDPNSSNIMMRQALGRHWRAWPWGRARLGEESAHLAGKCVHGDGDPHCCTKWADPKPLSPSLETGASDSVGRREAGGEIQTGRGNDEKETEGKGGRNSRASWSFIWAHLSAGACLSQSLGEGESEPAEGRSLWVPPPS